MVHPFRRNRGLTAAVVLTLSTGVGVSAAMVNLVDVLLFRPRAHVASPDRLVDVAIGEQIRSYRRLQRRARSLELAAYTRVFLTTVPVSDASVLRAESRHSGSRHVR